MKEQKPKTNITIDNEVHFKLEELKLQFRRDHGSRATMSSVIDDLIVKAELLHKLDSMLIGNMFPRRSAEEILNDFDKFITQAGKRMLIMRDDSVCKMNEERSMKEVLLHYAGIKKSTP